MMFRFFLLVFAFSVEYLSHGINKCNLLILSLRKTLLVREVFFYLARALFMLILE